MIVFLQPAMSMLVAVSIIALQLLRLSYFILPLSTIIEVSEEQPENVSTPILLMLLGMIMVASEEQPAKVRSSILPMLLGMEMDVSEEQAQKA